MPIVDFNLQLDRTISFVSRSINGNGRREFQSMVIRLFKKSTCREARDFSMVYFFIHRVCEIY